jgi:hypothetical protein
VHRHRYYHLDDKENLFPHLDLQDVVHPVHQDEVQNLDVDRLVHLDEQQILDVVRQVHLDVHLVVVVHQDELVVVVADVALHFQMDCCLQVAVVSALQEFQMDYFHQDVPVVLEYLLELVLQQLQDAQLVLVLQL